MYQYLNLNIYLLSPAWLTRQPRTLVLNAVSWSGTLAHWSGYLVWNQFWIKSNWKSPKSYVHLSIQLVLARCFWHHVLLPEQKQGGSIPCLALSFSTLAIIILAISWMTIFQLNFYLNMMSTRLSGPNLSIPISKAVSLH